MHMISMIKVTILLRLRCKKRRFRKYRGGGVRLQILIWERKKKSPFLQMYSLVDSLLLEKNYVYPSPKSNFAFFQNFFFTKFSKVLWKKFTFFWQKCLTFWKLL